MRDKASALVCQIQNKSKSPGTVTFDLAMNVQVPATDDAFTKHMALLCLFRESGMLNPVTGPTSRKSFEDDLITRTTSTVEETTAAALLVILYSYSVDLSTTVLQY
jgi:hypothetical protein